MDHLKAFLSQHDTNDLHHFGRKFTMYRDSYYSGGSGIVLSKGALVKMGETFKTADDEGWSGSPRGTGPEVRAWVCRTLGGAATRRCHARPCSSYHPLMTAMARPSTDCVSRFRTCLLTAARLVLGSGVHGSARCGPRGVRGALAGRRSGGGGAHGGH